MGVNATLSAPLPALNSPALIGGDNPSDAAAAALQLSGRDRDQEVGTIAYAWANQDMDAAFAWATGLPAGNTRNQAIQGALRAYASKDPEAAAEWAVQQPHVFEIKSICLGQNGGFDQHLGVISLRNIRLSVTNASHQKGNRPSHPCKEVFSHTYQT